MSDIKLKIRCECRQKFRVPARKIGSRVPCPGCSTEVEVPGPGDQSVIELICRCGQVVPAGERFCLGCGLGLVEKIESDAESRRRRKAPEPDSEEGASVEADVEPEKAEKKPEKNFRASDFNGPVEIPASKEIQEKTLVKFLCRCGQKIRLKYKQRGKGEPCPRCKEPLVVPDVTKEPQSALVCPMCETMLEKGRTRCGKCERELLVEIERTIAIYVPEMRDRPEVKDPAPPSPVAPTVVALPEPSAGPAPTEPALPAALPPRSTGAAPRRRHRARRAVPGPALVFSVGLLAAGAGIAWLFWGGRTAEVEEPAKEPSGAGALDWGGANPFDKGGGGPPPGGSNDPAGPKRSDPVRPADPPPDRELPEPPKEEEPELPPRGDGEPIRRDPERTPSPSPFEILIADDAAAPPASGTGGPASEGPRGEPDPEFFTKKIQPLMETLQCFQCHGNPALPTGRFKMKAAGRFGFNASTSRQNYETVLAFVNRSAPDKSPLLVKPLAIADGGAEHGGGDRFQKSDPAYSIWMSFLRGDAAGAAKPAAVASPPTQVVATGAAANLDASGSVDPVGKALRYQWTLLLGPPRAGARILNPTQAAATLRPDEVGTYVVELVVTDAAGAASDPVRVVVRARGPVAREYQTARPSDLDRALKLATVQRLYRDLAGREPTSPEIEEALGLTPEGMVRLLVADFDFWGAWFERDLAHLRLVDDFRPAEPDVVRLPYRMANGQISALDAFRTLLASSAYARRYPDPTVAARTLHQRLAGRRSDEGAGDADLAARLLAEDGFHDLYLQRHYRDVFGKMPRTADLARWKSSLRADATALGAIVLEWVTDRAYLAE